MVELDVAKRRIKPIEPLLVSAHTTAVGNWAAFLKNSPEFALPLDATTRANIINNHVCAEVDRLVADVAGIEPTDRLEFYALKIGAEVLLRFKYVGHGRPHNVATDQQKQLSRQEYTPEMTLALTGDASLAPPTLLTCGYTLDGDKVGRIEIRRDCRGHLPWAYDIYGGESVVQPLTLDGMADTAKPATVTSTRKREKGATAAEQA